MLVLAVAIGIGAFLTRGAGDRLFYRPDAIQRAQPTAGFERVRIDVPDGTELDGWWLPAEGESAATVVYCHGNHANLTHHVRFVRWLPGRGFNVLIFDYRGFGRSQGTPTRAGTVADAVAAIDFALGRDPARTVVFGHSLGGAVGLVAAVRRPAVRAVIVESTFPSYRAAARRAAPLAGFMAPWLVSAGLDPVDVLDDLPPCPLLVVHGTADRITPIELGQELFDAASEPKQLYVAEGGGHATPWVREGRAFENLVVTFVRRSLDGSIGSGR